MKEPFSIVVPTKDNPSFFERMLHYYRDQNLTEQIVVADASEPTHAKAVEATINDVSKSLNVVHKTYPAAIDFLEKLCDALSSVRTDLVVLGADDDFFTVAGLRAAARFLKEHPDFSLAHGEAAIFSVMPDGVYGKCAETSAYLQRGIELSTGAARLVDHFYRYSTTWYSMHRTEHLQRNIRKVAGLKMDRISFVELLPSCLSLIQGRTKKLDGLYMLRQVHAHRKQSRTAFEWIVDPQWSVQYHRMEDCLIDELIQQDRISREEALETVRKAFWFHLGKLLDKKWQQRYGRRSSSVRNRVETVVPGFSQIWQRGRSMLGGEENRMLLPSLLRPSSPHHADFMPIYRAIENGRSQP